MSIYVRMYVGTLARKSALVLPCGAFGVPLGALWSALGCFLGRFGRLGWPLGCFRELCAQARPGRMSPLWPESGLRGHLGRLREVTGLLIFRGAVRI